jgi:hypothetical protein
MLRTASKIEDVLSLTLYHYLCTYIVDVDMKEAVYEYYIYFITCSTLFDHRGKCT